MNTKLASKKIVFVIFFLLVFVVSAKCESIKDNNGIEYKLVSYNKIAEILNMISDKVQNNYKLIRTWEGKVKSELSYIHEGKTAKKIFKSSTNNIGDPPRVIMKTAEVVTEFSLDAEKNSVFVHNYPDKQVKHKDLYTGRDLGTKGISGEARSILTKEYYITCKAEKRRDGITTSRKALKQSLKDCTSCQSQPVFDPREDFGTVQRKTLLHILEQIKKNGEWKVDDYNLKVEEYKNGDIIDYKITIPGKITEGNIVFTTMTFSGQKGFNITLFQVTDPNGRIFQNGTWDYELVEDIYLPKEITHKNYMRKDGGLSYSKKNFYEDSRINHSIAPEKFTYKNLGLKEGDAFVDEIENKKYTYQKDGNLKEIVKQKADEKK